MSAKKGLLAAIVIALLFAGTAGWGADQLRDRDKDQQQLQDQLQDGSCQDAELVSQATSKGNGDCDRLRDCDGDCDGVPDQDRLREPARDGSCLV